MFQLTRDFFTDPLGSVEPSSMGSRRSLSVAAPIAYATFVELCLPRWRLEAGLLGPRYNFALQGGRQVAEVVAVACHSHDQVAVFLGFALRFPQRLGSHDVVLNVMAVELEIGT